MGILIGGLFGAIGILLLGLVLPRRKCPECGEPLSRFRKPTNARQALWGGWSCPKCGCEVDRRGRKIQRR